MFRTLEAAEQAAIGGDGGEEFDTQQCNMIQEEFYSSSPARGNTPEPEQRDRHKAPFPVAYDHDVHVHHILSDHLKQPSFTQLPTIKPPRPTSHPDPNTESVLPVAKKEVARRDPVAKDAVTSKPSAQPISFIRRNAKGQLRKFNSQGQEVPLTEDPRRAMEVENDFTQRSSMSLTQENSASAYENISVNRFATFQQSSVPDDAYFTKPAIEAETVPVRTDSTPYTYHENDTGHIALDFDIGDTNQTSDSQNVLSQDGASQDEDALQNDNYPKALEFSSSQSQFREPQTPAPPVNPFANRGTVMNGAELFGATQPSAVGVRFAGSPTSSRPSPDVYNNLETPAPYRTVSSPLAHTNKTLVRSLRQIPQSSSLKSKSFDPPALQLGSSLFEPTRYNSMQVSQEKRQGSSTPGSSGDDSDIEAEPKQIRKQKQKAIKKQLSSVEFRLPSSSGAVEVPSTSSKRRQSGKQVYDTQCDSGDTQEPQKDDVIADSQALPVDNNAESSPQVSTTDLHLEGEQVIADDTSASITKLLTDGDRNSTPDCPKTITQSLDAQHLPLHGNTSPSKNLPLSQSSLPLQVVSSNQKLLATPSKAKGHDDDAVPETSPATQVSLRPLGHIGVSFGEDEDDEDELSNLPGFSQDVGFEAIMNLRTASPTNPTRRPRREYKKEILNIFENTASLMPASSDVENFHTAPEAGVEIVVSTPMKERPKEVDKPNGTPKVEEVSEHIAVGATNPDPINAIHSLPSPQVDSTNTNGPANVLAPESAPKPAQAPAEKLQPLSVIRLEPNVDMAMDIDDTSDKQINEEISVPPISLRDKAHPDLVKATLKEDLAMEESIRTAPRTAPATPSVAESHELQTLNSARSTPQLGFPAPADQEPSVMQSTASSLSSAPASTLATPQPEEAALKKPRKIARGRPVKAKVVKKPASKATAKEIIPPPKQNKRKAAILNDSEESNRTSKRHSLRAAREDSIDPLSLPGSTKGTRFGSRLFTGMALTLSYMKRGSSKGHEKDHEKERDQMTKLIKEYGGQVLEDGFENLFDDGPRSGQVSIPITAVATTKRSLGFVAVIANIHSSKPKYMQALALGLPCLSPHWILSCVAKGSIVCWKPYLLCAGESPLLGLNFMSRHLTSYPSAAESKLVSTVAERPKILEGLSILAVGAKGIVDEKLKAFAFLGWVAAPKRFCLLASFEDARKQLLKDEAEGVTWDLVFCDEVRRTVETALFSNSPRKQKGVSTAANTESLPKKVRVINKEDLLQSFILGQLVEDQSAA